MPSPGRPFRWCEFVAWFCLVVSGQEFELIPQVDTTEHVRVSLAGGSCNVAVAWSVPSQQRNVSRINEVRYGLGLTRRANASFSSWKGRLWMRAVVSMEEDTTYQVGSRARRVRLPNCSNASGGAGRTRLALLGDLGVGNIGDDVLGRILNTTERPAFDAAIHLGDLGNNLSSEAGARALRFLEMLQPLASQVPYMTLPGDRDDLGIYKRLFQMSASSDPWYSFKAGHAKVVMLWTDALVDLGHFQQAAASRQLAWLEEELKTAEEERAARPWLIVAGHRPLYCSMVRPTCSSEAALLRSVLEPLFVTYGVDLYLSAHVHAYERTFRVLNGSVCTPEEGAACGPVHIVNGDAGDPPLQYADLPARFTAQRHPGQAGYGELILNATKLEYQQTDALTGQTIDQLVLTKELPLSPVGEENFLEAVGWLAFATAVATGTCGFVKWVHADGLKRRNEALRHLRAEIAVLSGMPMKAGSPREVEGLVHDSHSAGLH
ncbi:unnamed protein product [Effrenium voratum]|uniref:Acid phosphatase n=1 Tax=Effrenium voratum TaxID=2562239 RepID=A0AA36NAM9_9DINO|nr:unnamed protein product [Effrenium voratum]